MLKTIARVAAMAAAAAMAVSMWPAPPQVAAATIVEGIVYGSGCDDALSVTAVGRNGKELTTRTLVKGKKGYSFEASAVSTDDKTFLFTSYNCDKDEYDLYLQRVRPKTKAVKILDVPKNWRLLDATWDISRDRPVVLLQDPNFNYYIQIKDRKRWKTLWTLNRNDTGRLFLDGIMSDTGREFLIWGDDFTTWKTWRIRNDGRLIEEMSGTGQIKDVSPSTLNAIITITGSSGAWVCDRFTKGPIGDALTEGTCARIPHQGMIYGSALTYSDQRDTYWLHLDTLLGPNPSIQVTCVDATIFSCGFPRIGESQASAAKGAIGNLQVISFKNLKSIKRLRPTKI